MVGGTYAKVTVPSGASCNLREVTVLGDVTALAASRLVVDRSQVNGNIQGNGADVVHVSGGRIGGNIQVHDGSSPGETGVAITDEAVLTQGNIQVTKMRTGRIVITDVFLQGGNLQVSDNEVTRRLAVMRNRVSQNLEVAKHEGDAQKIVQDNIVGQTLTCQENAAPFIGGPNSELSAVGQCF